jgi:hypothetical protein
MRYLMLIFLIAAVILPTACAEQAPTTPEVILTSEEVLTYFAELHSTAVEEINLQLADLDEKIADVEEKETKLADIKARIDAEIALCDAEMAENKDIRDYFYWEYTIPEEYLEFYENERYKLVKFEVQYHYNQDRSDWNTFQDITIMDKATGVKDSLEVFEKSLAVEKSPYVRGKTAKLEAIEKANTILNDMLQNSDSWEIREEGDEIYSIAGYGLGYTDQLTTGKWLYYLGPKTMEPQSPDSTRLKDILTAKTS